MKRLFLCFILLGCVSCNMINPGTMFKTPKGYPFVKLPSAINEYHIAPNDAIEFKLFTNDGAKLVDIISTAPTTGTSQAPEFIVDKDGKARLPSIGEVTLQGLTIKEAQSFLESKFAEFYVKPFVLLKITNKRVLVFPGAGGTGTVVILKNDNTSLIEVLALAGGIQPTGKAKRVKLVRGDLSNPQIQLIDLSTIEGIKSANVFIQPNDIVYVEPVRNYGQGIFTQLSPYIGLLTTAVLIMQLTRYGSK